MPPLAYSIEDLMRLTGLGRTLIYDEVRDGRLIRTKCRRRSIYLPKHVASWLESLAREKARPRLDDPTDDESDPGI